MKTNWWIAVTVALALAGAAARAAEDGPAIDHAPVSVSARGQPVIIRAKATAPAGVRSLNLYCSVSSDAAPFKIPMQSSAGNMYVGAIPNNMIQNVAQVSYYLEAFDNRGEMTETPWYVVKIREPEVNAPVDAGGGGDAGTPAWVIPAAIAGGAAVVGGAVLIASRSSGGGSSDDGGEIYRGNYIGNATACYQPPGSNNACSTHAIIITITQDNKVYSDTLRPGDHLETYLTGTEFAFTVPIRDAEQTGSVLYTGTVVDRKIVGTMDGSVDTPGGVGLYNGTFMAYAEQLPTSN